MKRHHRTKFRLLTLSPAIALGAVLLGVVPACGGGDDDTSDEGAGGSDGSTGGSSSGTGGGDGGMGGGGSEDELYVLATELETPEGDMLYLGTTSNLSEPFDLVADGIEIANASTFQALGEQVFVGLNDAPTITRYVVDDEGQLQEDETLSFAGVGVTSAMTYSIISPTKAYLFDEAGLVVHVWNPSTMELTGTEIDFGEAANEDRGPIWLNPWRFDHIQRDGHLFVGGGWWHPENGPAPYSLALAFDTSDDTVEVLEDDRCVNIGSASMTEDGDVYFFYQSYGLALAETAPCALVIRDGETTFDPDFVLDVSEWMDGRIPSAFNAGPGNTIYAEVPYAERIDGDDTLMELFFEAGNDLRLWQIDLAAEEAHEVEDIDFLASTRWSFVLGDGRALMPVFSLVDPADEARGYVTDMYEVFAEGHPVPFEFGDDSDEVQARLSDVVRLR